jgi:hypothetical protein
MPTAGEIAIEKNISGPKRAQVDGVDVEQYDMDELIAADKYVRGNTAVKTGLGIKITRIESPDAVG